jgi:hypothetical protein
VRCLAPIHLNQTSIDRGREQGNKCGTREFWCRLAPVLLKLPS